MKDGLYRFLRPLLTFLIKIVFRPKIIGKENIPKKGRIILAGNHTNILDPVLLLACTNRTIHFLAKKELIDSPLGFAFKHMGIIPVNRKIKDKTVMPNAEKCLNSGKIIGIFPEGTTEKGRGLMPFKYGAVKLAQNTNTSIISFGISGKYNLFKNNLTIIFEKPYKIENYLEKENEVLRNKVGKLIKEGEIHGKNK